MSTAGNEGTFQAMISGDVDERWAELHHDVWYDELMAQRGSAEAKAESTAG
jgi:formate dehydrogenase subunit gamma